MAGEKHTLHIHVDAPVADVFDYLEDPVHFVAGLAENHHASVVSVERSRTAG
ncbi:hypothetical protein [Isoptericola sp. AK164]|uniref:hypothetical protein n=1 Tax=Isoptericola sp. AK164 TaxID=3024246 RepID=UPI0024182359|nr:hypothetical protein [Isoptericola sp. AK164]